MKRKRVTVLVLLVLTSAVTFAHDPSKHEDPVAAVLNNNARGFETGDLKLLDTLWAHDDRVTVFESGHANYGWVDYRDHHLKPEIAEMKNVKYRLSEIRSRVSGDTAWATFKYALEADLKERHVNVNGLGTAVLEKRGADWKIVHWHTSAPRRPAPAPASR